MAYNDWIDLNEKCPIDIDRIITHARGFNSKVNIRISIDNLNKAKKCLLEARRYLDSTIISLIQLLYDRNILKKVDDHILFTILSDNFGRLLKRLDTEEHTLIIKPDEPGESKVGISRLSSYSKLLKSMLDSLIYESLLKAIKEYENIKENGIIIRNEVEEVVKDKDGKDVIEEVVVKDKDGKDVKVRKPKMERVIVETKIKKEPRTFLYILFQILQVTSSVIGGLTREETSGVKRGIVSSVPLNWQTLMTKQGQDMIKKDFKEETGQDLSELEDLEDLEEDGEEND